MRIPYGFNLVNNGVLEVNKNEASNIRMIFDNYLAEASLGKVVSRYPLRLGKRNGPAPPWITFSPTPSTLLLLVLNPMPVRNMKKPTVAMSTMIKRVHREKKPGMSHLLCLRYNFYSKFPIYFYKPTREKKIMNIKKPVDYRNILIMTAISCWSGTSAIPCPLKTMWPFLTAPQSP